MLTLIVSIVAFNLAPVIIAVVITAVVHELCHARAMLAVGDTTPLFTGRWTINPLSHLDPLGTLLLLTQLVGWTRQVPVNRGRYQSRTALVGVLAAGTAGNLLLVMVFSLGWAVFAGVQDRNVQYLMKIIAAGIICNVNMIILNLLPLPLTVSDLGRLAVGEEKRQVLDFFLRLALVVLIVWWGGVFFRDGVGRILAGMYGADLYHVVFDLSLRGMP